MLVMTGVLRLGKSQFVTSAIDEDSAERILLCLRFLDDYDNDALKSVFLQDCKKAFDQIVNEENGKKDSTQKGVVTVVTHADDLLRFRQLTQLETMDDQVCLH